MPDAAEARMMLSMPCYPGLYLMRKILFAAIMTAIITIMNAAHIMEGITAIADMKAVTAIHRNNM